MKVRSFLLPALLTVALAACGERVEVPTYRVERQPFTHHITVEGTLQAAQATALSVPSDLRSSVRLAWLAPEGARVEKDQVVALFDPKPMEEKLDEGNSDLQSASLKIDKSEIDSAARITEHETEQQVAEIELDYSSRFLKDDAVIFSRNEIVESQIDHELATHRKDHATVSQDIQRRLAATELELLAIDQRRAQNKIDQANSSLRALEVRAPHDGILTLARTWHGEPLYVGAEMWRGQAIGEIPNLEQMEAEVFVLEADAGGLEVGKPATVVLEAQPEAAYEATIKRINAVAQPRFRDSPVQYFSVILEFPMPEGKVLKPGQRVRATLKLADVEEALVVPRQTVFQAEDQHYVYLQRDGGFIPSRVEIGATSVAQMTIADGVEVGDRLAMTRPANSPEFEPASFAEAETVTAEDPEAEAAGETAAVVGAGER